MKDFTQYPPKRRRQRLFTHHVIRGIFGSTYPYRGELNSDSGLITWYTRYAPRFERPRRCPRPKQHRDAEIISAHIDDADDPFTADRRGGRVVIKNPSDPRNSCRRGDYAMKILAELANRTLKRGEL